MTEEEFAELREGDMVRHKLGGNAFIVSDSHGPKEKTIVRTETIFNPREWLLVLKARRDRSEA